jgi:outer membrane protein OmpA-like peptidoglycan-associated protein
MFQIIFYQTNRMKKLIIFFTASFCLIITASAQLNYAGYRSANYIGVNGVFFNPANVADSRMRWDVNLIGANAGVINNTTSYSFSDIKNAVNGNADTLFFNSGSKAAKASANVDVLGPSFLIRLDAKSSFAVTTRVRTIANINDIDGQLIDGIKKQTSNGVFTGINTDKNQRVAVNGWADIGLSYGRVLYEDETNFMKAGFTVKYLGGYGNSYLNINKLNTNITKDVAGDYYLSGASGGVAVGVGGLNIDDFNGSDFSKFSGSGIGGDFGFIYENRPNGNNTSHRYKNKYRYKAGFALLDLGSIKYTADPKYTASYGINVAANQRFYLKNLDGKSLSEIKQYLDTSAFFTKNGNNGGKYSVSLPSTIQLNVDYNINNGFYVDAAAQISLSKNAPQNPSYQNNFTVTPRLEMRALGVYLPLNYNSFSGFNAGLSISAGPLYIGSGSIITALFNNTKQVDVHAGIRFGSFEKKNKKEKEIEVTPEEMKVTVKQAPQVEAPKDTDGDGFFDNDDKCVTVPGVAKYFGCPVPDTDGDGINDEEDKCITIPGLAKYFGCPIPDTDGDGINDEEDKCPSVPGEKVNMGCPIIKEEIVKTINFAAKNILFQTGKAVLIKSSFAQLDKVAVILKADENIKLSIEGHTDNVGKPAANMILSDKRAAAVKDYLIKKGVTENNISAKGFGDMMPAATNKTPAGKKLNRRVELKVSY